VGELLVDGGVTQVENGCRQGSSFSQFVDDVMAGGAICPELRANLEKGFVFAIP
jgi:hypothetical protein